MGLVVKNFCDSIPIFIDLF